MTCYNKLMNFTAIDFETANEKINSVCQVGIVVVKKGKISDRAAWMVRPIDNLFNKFNTYVHGITAEQVENEPEFYEIWPFLNKYLEGQTIIAHNASFDIGVLRSVLDMYGFEYPQAEFVCSVKIAKKVWRDISKHGLKSMAKHLDIEFTHHDAAEDAFASAEIVRRAAKEMGVNTLEQLLEKIEIHPGKLYPGGYLPIRQLNEFNLTKVDIENLDPDHPFYGQTVVFTGKLDSIVRKKAMQNIANVGGICAASINEFTNFLIVGSNDYKRFKDEGLKSRKIKKAEVLIEQGNSIELITEKEFLELLKNKTPTPDTAKAGKTPVSK
jgi:DNA polymerase-3 subunit epsilon